MSKRIEWAEARKETLRRLLAEGMSYKQAASSMGIRREQARNAANHFDLAPPRPRRKWREWSRHEYDMLERLLGEALTYDKIALRMGLGINEVKGTAQRLGLMSKERVGQHRRRDDWPAIDRIVTDCIEAKLMTIPQTHRYLSALGHQVGLSTLYVRIEWLDRNLRARAKKNGKIRKTDVGHRLQLAKAARKRQQQKMEAA